MNETCVILEVSYDLRDSRWWTQYEGIPDLERTEDLEFRTSEWREV